MSPGSLARSAPCVHPAATATPRPTRQRHLRVPGVRGAFLGRTEMRPMPAVLSSCRPWRTMSILRRARRFGRPPAGDGLILTTTSMMPAMATLLLGQPETGRGDASLWTAAAAPDHRLWTTLRGPLDPSRLPTSPLPRRRLRVAREQPIPTIQRRDDLLNTPVADLALVNIQRPRQVGHSRVSKWAIPACQKQLHGRYVRVPIWACLST